MTSPRHPMTSSMGTSYTLASDTKGFTALPNPEFCMYTIAGRAVDR